MRKIKFKNKIKYQFNILMKKLVSILVIITSIFFYLPVISFAADSNSDNDKKSPALVPVAADSIISKYVDTNFSGGSESNSSNSSSRIITDNKEKGNGWDSITTVKYPNGTERTYRNYKQFPNNEENDYYNYPYWDGKIRDSGCGPTSIAIILSGYGYDYNPRDVVQKMSRLGITYSNYDYLVKTLKSFNIDCELKSWTDNSEKEIKKNFEEGRPMIVGVPNHFVTYVGLDKDEKLIISDPGKNDGQHGIYGATIPELKRNQSTHQYILIKSNGTATSDSSNSSSKNSSNNESDSSSSKTDSNNNTSGSGKVISTSNYNSTGGYSGVYESRTTGKKFKEYKQDSSWAISTFPKVAWTQECGKISALIIGSGYTNKATYKDLYENILEEGKQNPNVHSIINTYTNTNSDFQSMVSIETLKDALSEGCVASIHVSGYPNTPTHFLSILDIDETKTKIYLSDPCGKSSSYDGWKDISIVSSLGTHEICFVSSDGKVVDYSGDGDSSDSSDGSSESNIDMSKNIVPNGRGGYKINIKLNKEIDDMLAKLKKTDFKMESYLSSKNQKKYLKNMIKAAIVTQYPDLRSAQEIENDDEVQGETQGCIRIKRYPDGETKAFAGIDNNDEGIYLAYKPYEEFYKMISDGDKNALKYFSMDSSNNIVVAGWETMEVEISGPTQTNASEVGNAPDSYKEEYTPISQPYSKLTEKKVSYLNQVSNYTMPFSLMWSLLVYGHDEDFVNDLAKLVISTDIIIGCYDATDVRVTSHDFTYSKIGEAKIEARLSNPTSETPHASDTKQYTTVQVEYKFKVTETDTLKTDNPSLNVIYADTWTAVYKRDFKVKSETKKSDEQTSNHGDKTTETNYYTINGEKYSGDRKPDDETLTQKIDETVEKESEDLLNKELEELRESVEGANRQIQYKYQALSKKINEIYSRESNADLNKFLNIKDVQSYIINMIIDQSSNTIIESTFNVENALMLKYAKSVNSNDHVSILNKAVQAVQFLQQDEELYNEITKNNKDFTKAQVYNTNITSVQITEEKKKTNNKETINETTTTSQVEEVPTSEDNVRFKKDKNADENSFVKLLAYSKSANGNLQIVNAWFFDSLEDTEAIADLEDLMKYLFQCVYKQNYGIKKEDIEKLKDLFDPDKFQSIGSKSSSSKSVRTSDMLWEFIKAWESHEGLSEDGKKYRIGLVLGNRTVGYGFDIDANGYEDTLKKAGYSTNVGDYIDVDFIDNLSKKELSEKRQAIINQFKNCNPPLNEQQIDALTAIAYQYGPYSWKASFIDAYSKYGNTDQLRYNVYTNGSNHWQIFVKGPESNGRPAANWKLFHEGKYTNGRGQEITL